MTALSIKEFTGMIPRKYGQLLPDNAAEWASNCDFSRNVLAPLKGGLEVLNVGGLIRGIFTEEGFYWYTWPSDVVAYKSPVIGEIYQRIYYIDGSVLRASPSPKAVSRTTGGPPVPADSPRVGVPNPTKAPTLDLIERTTLADYPGASFSFKAWYSDGVAQYNTTTLSVGTQAAFRRYTFTAPAKTAGTPPAEEGGEVTGATPETATLVVQATLTDGTKQLMQLDTSNNSSMAARSQALPGGVVMTLEHLEPLTSENYAINFTWGAVETRAYVFTVTNTWEEESGPSPVTLISPTYLQDVRVTMVLPDFTPGYRPWKQTNVYRTYGGPQYILAGSIASNIFTDQARTVTTIGVSLPSLSWKPPPMNLFDLVLMPNGWFAGHYFNILYMSEPFRPHTWPYSITFPDTILGMCVGPQMIVVTTTTASYMVTGPHPHSVTSSELPVPVGGIDTGASNTRRGMCAVDGGVAYLSNDGVVLVEGSQASLEMSQRYFTREVWRTQFGNALPTMQLAYHDGYLVAVSSQFQVGFMLDMQESGGAMTRFNYPFDVMLRLPLLDSLYYSVGGKVFRFREGTALNAEWTSKQFLLPKYAKFGIGFARMLGTGKITLRLYANHSTPDSEATIPDPIYTLDLNPADHAVYFRLPSHVGAIKWQFRVNTEGPCSLEDLAFAQTPDELKGI